MTDNIMSVTHEVKMVDRGLLSLSGITKIVSFDNTEFILESVMGAIHIKGNNLELLSMDLQDTSIRIKGKINGINYIEKTNKKKEESIISKLFK